MTGPSIGAAFAQGTAPSGPWRLPPLGAVGRAATLHALLVSAAFTAWHLAQATQPPWLAALVSATPTLVSSALAITSQHDRRQYCARLLAAMMMSPLAVLFWSIDGPLRLGWGLAVALAFCVLHAAAFVVGLRWLAAGTTRIDAAPAVPPVSAGVLATRLVSLASTGLPLRARATVADPCVFVSWSPTGQRGRTHAVELRLGADRREVTVIERLQAAGAAPLDDGEASMRAPGEPALDPSRPDAQRLWLRTLQATMLDPARLDAAPVTLSGDRVRWSGPTPPALPDTDALMACLAAIVVRSGWAWQPQLGD